MNRGRRNPVLAGVLVLLVVSTSLAGSAAASPVQDAVSVKTSYDGATPSQEIDVIVTIQAQDTTLRDVNIGFASGERTHIQADSYATRVQPSNQGIEVTPAGANSFTIPELEPGEEVRIAFDVVPRTLAYEEVVPATATVRFTRYGQQVQDTVSERADLSTNPWIDPPEDRASFVMITATTIVTAGSALVVATVFYRRARTRRTRVYEAVEEEASLVSRAGNRTVERRVDQLLETLATQLDLDREDDDGSDTSDGTKSGDEGGIRSILNRIGPGGSESKRDSSGPNL